MLIFLCDDNASERAYIKSLVLGWADRSGADLPGADLSGTDLPEARVCLREYPSAEALLFAWEDGAPDILLLDIEMPGMNGVELARKLRERKETAQIIFITGYPDFMAEGYEVEALHYLIKPVTPEKLAEVLSRAAEKISRAEKKLLLPSDGSRTALPLKEIRYIEAMRQYSVIYAASGEYRLKVPISKLEARLDGYFLRVQRSFIVNLREVLRINRTEVILRSGEAVPISRGMADRIGKKIIELF